MATRAKSLDELKGFLLYHTSTDLWMVLCREKGWNWKDPEAYDRFVGFLREKGVGLKEAPAVTPLRILDRTLKTFTVRLDDEVLAKIRAFKLKQ